MAVAKQIPTIKDDLERELAKVIAESKSENFPQLLNELTNYVFNNFERRKKPLVSIEIVGELKRS